MFKLFDMNTTLIAGIVLLVGAAFLLWKGKAAFGIELAKMFSSKKVLLIEFIMFVLIFVHAHTAAELAVKAGWGYNQRFILHSFVNFFSFVLSMSLYKNGHDVGAALKGHGNFLKEFGEAFALLMFVFATQFALLWMMCAGFKQPYTAFLLNKDYEYIGFVKTFAGMYDFQLASSIVIIFLEFVSAAGLVILGSASVEIKPGSVKNASTTKGGFISGIAGMFGNMIKPQVKSDKADVLAEKVCHILGRPQAAVSVATQLNKDQRITLKGLVAEWETAQDFQKQSIKSRIERIINE